MSGFILIWRSVFESPFYFSEKFTKSQAWFDLILIANHSSQYIDKRGNLIEVKRGFVGYSKLALAKRWKWSETKVNSFIKTLEKMEQVKEQKIGKITTLIQILNYEKYQPKRGQTEEQKADRKGAESGQKRTNNECKEGKEVDNTPAEIQQAVNYLNQTCGKNYRVGTPKTQSLIKTLLKNGFTLEDIKKVIDSKSTDPYFIENGYLRPETLFNLSKFEGYLNTAESDAERKRQQTDQILEKYNYNGDPDE